MTRVLLFVMTNVAVLAVASIVLSLFGVQGILAENGVDLVVAVGGDLAKQLALAAGAAGVPDIAMVGDNATAAAYLNSILRPDDVVLVRASRGGQLWQIAQALTGQPVTGL